MTLSDDILGLLKQHGPLTDAELRNHLHLRHQTINQTARKLAEAGRIIREMSGGTIVNRLPGQKLPLAQPPEAASSDGERITEDEVKTAVKHYLESQGYEVQVAWARTRGIDIDARGSEGRVIIEAKGEAPPGAQQVNYFLGALGELVQRMDDSDARYALALPDHKQYRGLVERLPRLARQRLNLTIYFVRRDHDRYEVEALSP